MLTAHWRIASILYLFLATGAVAHSAFLEDVKDAENARKRGSGKIEWDWKRSEEREIEKIAKSLEPDKDGFWTRETDNWIVRSNVSAAFTAEASMYMEIFQEVFQKVFYFKTGLSLDTKPTFTIFWDRAEYLAIPDMPQWTAGVFMFGYGRKNGELFYELNLYAHLVPDKKGNLSERFVDSPLPTIQHEATHCLLAKLMGPGYPKLPVWLNERMATYYEYWDLRAKVSSSGNLKKDIRARKERLKRSPTPYYLGQYMKQSGGKPPELRYLTSLLTQQEWSQNRTHLEIGMHYARPKVSLTVLSVLEAKGVC